MSTIPIDTRKRCPSMDKYNHQKKIGQKQRAHKKAKNTEKKKDMDSYKRLKQKVQWEIRQANKKYMEDVSTDYKDNSKQFWSYIKSKGQE